MDKTVDETRLDTFITYEGRDENDKKIYIAWDETRSYELGMYQTWDEAAEAVREHIKIQEKWFQLD